MYQRLCAQLFSDVEDTIVSSSKSSPKFNVENVQQYFKLLIKLSLLISLSTISILFIDSTINEIVTFEIAIIFFISELIIISISLFQITKKKELKIKIICIYNQNKAYIANYFVILLFFILYNLISFSFLIITILLIFMFTGLAIFNTLLNTCNLIRNDD